MAKVKLTTRSNFIRSCSWLVDFIVSERCVFVALIITGDFLLEGFLGEPSNMEKFVDSSFAKKKGKTTNSVRQKLDARAEDFRGRISQNKRPSFDWIFSKLKYNKNTWPVHSTSEYCSDSGAIKGNYLPMFNLRIDLFNSVFFGENHWIFNKCALAVNLGDVNIPLFH